MSPYGCDPDRLLEVLNADESHPDHELVTAHVTECSQCQATVEGFAADEWWWDHGRDWLVASEATKVAPSSTSIAAVEDEISAPNRVRIDFLEPPSQPELLGQLGKYQIESVIGQGGMANTEAGNEQQERAEPFHSALRFSTCAIMSSALR